MAWKKKWKPLYFSVINIFAEVYTFYPGADSSLGPPAKAVPDRVRLAHPWEMQAVLAANWKVTPSVRLGMVSHAANLLGHGLVPVVPDWDPEYLVNDKGSTGNSKEILLMELVDLVPVQEGRRKVERR